MATKSKQFCIVLKNTRIEKNLTQAELAEILDISLPYLKDLERFRNNPSYEMLKESYIISTYQQMLSSILKRIHLTAPAKR